MRRICILAHPFLISDQIVIGTEEMNREEYIERLIEAGLTGSRRVTLTARPAMMGI